MSKYDKKKLREILGAISDPDEKDELRELDILLESDKKIEEIGKFSEEKFKKFEESLAILAKAIITLKSNSNKFSDSVMDGFNSFTVSISKKLEDLGGTISTSYEKNKPFNAAPVYKDIINQLSSVKKSIDDKPVPVWNWPQYSSVGLRNKSFSNVNPAVDSLELGSYDYVSMALSVGNTTETYTFKQGGSSGSLVATVVLVYTNSTRNVLVSVTKTPVVTS